MNTDFVKKVIASFIAVLLMIGIFEGISYAPAILIASNSERIATLSSYIYNKDTPLIHDESLDKYMLDPDNSTGLKTMLVIGCDNEEGGIDGCYGADILMLVTSSSKTGEVHIYSINRDTKMLTIDGQYHKVTDICRSYQINDFISTLEMNLRLRIDNYIMFKSKDNIVEQAAANFIPDGLDFELNEIELIGLNQILLNTLSPEEQETELFRDNSGNVLGISELNQLSTPACFIGFYTRPGSDVKIFTNEKGEPLDTDENGEPVELPVTDLEMYVQYFREDDDRTGEIEFQGKYYVPCMNTSTFSNEAYAAKVYLINDIFGTNYSTEKKTYRLTPKQIQALSRLRHSYLDQSISRSDNVAKILTKMFTHLSRHPFKLLNSEETEEFFKEIGSKGMVQTSCQNLAVTAMQMYDHIAPVQYGKYVITDKEVRHMKTIPNPYLELDKYSIETQMHWIIYGC